jgi:hypothetical protein
MTAYITALSAAFEGTDLRIVMRDDEPWWVLADVCRPLGIENSRNVARRLDADEKDTVQFMDGVGRPHRNTIINESGLYGLIQFSRKPAARRFSKWVRGEVLPQIRRTGAYQARSAAPPLEPPRAPAKLPELPPFPDYDPFQRGAADAPTAARHYAWDLVNVAYGREYSRLLAFLELVWKDQPAADPAAVMRFAVDHPHLLDHPALAAHTFARIEETKRG